MSGLRFQFERHGAVVAKHQPPFLIISWLRAQLGFHRHGPLFYRQFITTANHAPQIVSTEPPVFFQIWSFVNTTTLKSHRLVSRYKCGPILSRRNAYCHALSSGKLWCTNFVFGQRRYEFTKRAEFPTRPGDVSRIPEGSGAEKDYHSNLYQEYTRRVSNFQFQMIALTFKSYFMCPVRRSHWFHTVLVSQAELEKVCNNASMKKRWGPSPWVHHATVFNWHEHFRTYRFAILGLSLSTLLDINQPQDLLRALLNAITEYDQAKEEGDNKSSKMVILFLHCMKEPSLNANVHYSAYQIQQRQKPKERLFRPCRILSGQLERCVLSLRTFNGSFLLCYTCHLCNSAHIITK